MADLSALREIATREHWKHEPLPVTRERLVVSRTYPIEQWNLLKRGLIPVEMEDRWFIFADGLWLHFHRSWTGYCIYSARFELQPSQLLLAEAWAYRDPTHHYKTDVTYDRDLLYYLIASGLLDDPDAECPSRQNVKIEL